MFQGSVGLDDCLDFTTLGMPEVIFKAVDVLEEIESRIKQSLSVNTFNFDTCEHALQELIDLPVTRTMLKRCPSVVSTIKKVSINLCPWL